MARVGAPWKYGEPTDWVSMRLPRWVYQLAKSLGKPYKESAPAFIVAQMDKFRRGLDPVAEKRAAELQVQIYKLERRIAAEERLTASWARRTAAKQEQVERLQRRLRQRAFILKRLLKVAGADQALKHLDLDNLHVELEADIRAEAAEIARKYREARK